MKKILFIYPFLFIAFTWISVMATWYPVEISIVTHLIFPTLAMLTFGMLTPFGYIKLNSLMLGRLFVILAALGWGEQSIQWVYLLMFQLNILEATLLDGYTRHYPNAVAGALLLASSFYLVLGWTGSYLAIENTNFVWWILAYTIWNANFVTLQLSGAYYAHHYLLLLSPIFACLVLYDFSGWLVFRETSLLLGIATLTCFQRQLLAAEKRPPFKQWLERVQDVMRTQKVQRLIAASVVLLVVVQFLYTRG